MKLASVCALFLQYLSVVVQADVVSPPNGGAEDCWISTREIGENELQLNSDNTINNFTVAREYILCSTTYQIGLPSVDEEELDWPILVINPNLHIICPKTTASSDTMSNECTFEIARAGANAIWTPPGAQVPFAIGSQTVDSASADGFKMTGVIVTRALSSADSDDVVMPAVIFTIQAINVLIQGCHFRSLDQGEAIYLDYPATALVNLSDDRLFQRVTVEDCIFEESKSTFVGANAADISTRDEWPLGSMTIRRSYFVRGNETLGPSIFMPGQIILEVTDNCFDDTRVSDPTAGPSIGHLLGTDNLFKNNFGDGEAWGDPDRCFKPGIRVTSDNPDEGCLDFDASVCAFDLAMPTPSPSAVMPALTQQPALPASTPLPTTSSSEEPTSTASSNIVDLVVRTTLLLIVAALIVL